MKIFITGVTGFVGSHLARKLTENGDEVFGLVRNRNKLENENLNITAVNGTLSYTGVNHWIDQLPEDLDCIIHVAGIVHSFNEDDFFNINTKATKQLISDLKNRFQELKFIFISSLAAAGPGIKSETDPLTPVSQYGKSKKEAEELLPTEWNTVIIRPPMIIGPGDPAILDIYKMVKSKIILTAGKEARYNQYSFVCVHDLVEAIIKSISYQTEILDDFFISHEKIIKFEDIIDEIAKCMNITPFYLPMPIFMLKFAANALKNLPMDFRLTPDKINELIEPSWVCSNTKSLEKLDMNYSWDLKSTIRLTFDDYKKRGWI